MFKNIMKFITKKYVLIALAIIALSVGGFAFYKLKQRSPVQNIDETVEEIEATEDFSPDIEQIAQEITRAAITPAAVSADTADLGQVAQVMPTELDRDDFSPIA